MIKVWYEIRPLSRRVGYITDYYMDYVEVKDKDTGQYFIKHESKIIIKDDSKYNNKYEPVTTR